MDCLPESIDLAVILVFLTIILACKGGREISICTLQILLHIGAPSMNLTVLFCSTSRVDISSLLLL